ncbi:MAG: M23 family metallopeptidase [Lachnospiraceae bacterium]|nr:M23 family metallopeptidase [Lachnospiraceae bacterium]
MKMRKENMDHIKARFENETGVKLPEKESFEMPAWTGRFIAAAAGFICLVGLGLVWHKVSIDKQGAAETMLADGDEGIEETVEETEETADTESVENDQGNTDDEPAADNDDQGAESEITVDAESPDDLSDVTTTYNLAIFDDLNDANGLVDLSLFGEDINWTWPVVSDAEHFFLTNESFMDDPDNTEHYVSIPGTIGDDVISMLTCDVTKTGFDTKRGNYVETEFNGTCITYSHLDTICVSEGDHLDIGGKIGTLGNTGASTGPHLGITVTDASGKVFQIISAPAEDDGFYEEEVIEE